MSESSAEKRPNNALRWGVRAVLLVIVLVAVLLAVSESNVQSQYSDSFNAVGDGVDTVNLYKKDVDALLKGSPKREKINELEEKFVWSGPLSFIYGDYAFRLYYESDGFVRRIEPEGKSKE